LEMLASESHFDAKELAKMCRLSIRQLQLHFRDEIGRTPQDWLNEQKIKAAERMLLLGEPIKMVSSEMGFKQTSHFCRQFKSFCGWTPSEFVKFHPLEADVAHG